MLTKQFPDKANLLLALFWDLLVNPAHQVRSIVIQLFGSMITILNYKEISNRVLPALITLSTDPDQSVRFNTIKVFGDLASHSKQDALLEKIAVPFDSFLDGSSQKSTIEVIKTFARIAPAVTTKFRESFLAPKLLDIARNIGSTNNDSNKREIALTLFETYRAFSGISMHTEAITNHIIPGLQCLLDNSHYLDTSYQSLLTTMINELTAKTISPEKKKEDAKEESVGKKFFNFKNRFLN